MSGFKEKLILKEIEIIQNRIANYDKQSLLIKGWAITLWSGIWIYITNQMMGNINPIFIFAVLMGVFALVFFWAFDSLFKHFQRGFIFRIIEIEDNIKDNYDAYIKEEEIKEEEIKEEEIKEEEIKEEEKNESIILFNPSGDKSKKYKIQKEFWRSLLLRQVSVFYTGLLGISFFGITFIFFGIEKIKICDIYAWIYFSLGIIFIFICFVLLFLGHDKYFDRISNRFKEKEKREKKISILKTTVNELKDIMKNENKNYNDIITDILQFYKSNK